MYVELRVERIRVSLISEILKSFNSCIVRFRKWLFSLFLRICKNYKMINKKMYILLMYIVLYILYELFSFMWWNYLYLILIFLK